MRILCNPVDALVLCSRPLTESGSNFGHNGWQRRFTGRPGNSRGEIAALASARFAMTLRAAGLLSHPNSSSVSSYGSMIPASGHSRHSMS